MDNAVENWIEELKNIVITNYDVGSSHWVDVTHIINPQNFYVRPTSARIHLDSLQAHGDQVAPSSIYVRKVFIYRSKTFCGYVRGKVVSINSTPDTHECDMFAIDYGAIEKRVPFERIYKCSIDLPPLAIHCMLADCKPLNETFDDKAIDAMKCYVGEERARMFVKGRVGDQLIVELINTCPDDIATMLALTGYTTFGFNHAGALSRFTAPKPQKNYFAKKALNVGDVLHVRVQSGRSLRNFFVCEISDYFEYLLEKDDLASYCKTQREVEEIQLVENTPIAVYDFNYNRYDRGLIKKIIRPSKGVEVQLVDWGTIEVAGLTRLRMMKETFLSRPMMAIYCSAEPKQEWDNNLHNCMRRGYEFKIKIKKLGNGFLSPNIVTLSKM